MREYDVRSISDAEKTDREGFIIRKMTSKDVLSKIGAMQVDVLPGKDAFSYHYHGNSEEIFYIIRGKGRIRTYDGCVDVKEGDYISFPTGEGGAHIITNTSDEVLSYINFHSISDAEVGYFPDAKKVMIADKNGKRFFDLPDQ